FVFVVFWIRTVASPAAAMLVVIGCLGYGMLLHFNRRELKRLHGSVHEYSLSRIYQLRENVEIMRVLGPSFLMGSLSFLFRTIHLFLPDTPGFELIRLISIALFDLWIALTTAVMIVILPLFNFRFRRPAAKILFYKRLMRTMKFESR
ncbi:hypothetical protein PFISCL1PPCAC_27938, partial [Pristionchus fissidentatus]